MNLAALVFSLLLQTRLSQQIVVTASNAPETIESTPASVTVINRSDIDQRGARDVADVLREVPGLTLARSGSPGKQISLFARGAASTQTLVLWNGIEINNPYFSGFDWGRFSTAGVERVEVVRGPYSALYGSEAMAGVINVLTTPSKTRLRADVQAGEHGLQNEAAGGAWIDGALMLSGAAEHRQDDGFNANDDFRQNSADVFGRWSKTNYALGLHVRGTSYDLGIPFNTDASGTRLVPSLSRRQNGNESEVVVPITFNAIGLSNDVAISISRRRDDFLDPEDPFTTSTRTDSSSHRARLTSRTAQTVIGTIVGGAEYERQSVSDFTNLGPNFVHRTRSDRALFLEDRLSLSEFELSLGVRNDRFETFGSQTSPRIAAAWTKSGHKVRAAYGEGFRAPSLGELYYPFFGNAGLNAERNQSFEVGYDLMRGSGLFSITYFNSRYRELITFDPATFISANIGRVRADGAEAGVQWTVMRSLSATMSYTYLHTANDESTGQRLPRRPRDSASLFVNWTKANFESSVIVLHTGARPDREATFPFGLVSDRAYTTLDFIAQLHTGVVTPLLKIENLRDTHYEDVRGFAAPRRRATLGLRLLM